MESYRCYNGHLYYHNYYTFKMFTNTCYEQLCYLFHHH
jgi:hypothetical protein